MAFIQIHRSSTVTDEHIATMVADWLGGKLLEGLNYFAAGRTNGQAVVVESWANREACDRALESFMPVAEKLGLTMNDWQSEEYEILDELT